jgi:hypothetical protein
MVNRFRSCCDLAVEGSESREEITEMDWLPAMNQPRQTAVESYRASNLW